MKPLTDKEARDYKLNQANILWAWTSVPDYEMNRVIIAEHKHDEYVVLEGYHCSCYGFEDVKWEGTIYTTEELLKLKNKPFSDFVKENFSDFS